MNAQEYKRDGFTVLRRAFTPGWPEGKFERLMSQWKELPKDEYRWKARVWGAAVSQTSVFTIAPILSAVSMLGVRDRLFLTTPAVHAMGVDESWEGTKAHQDWPSLQTGLNTVVCWVPFTAVGLDSYPLEFAKGSHLRGLLPAKAGEHYSEADTAGMEFVPVTADVGDVIFFSVFTAHRTRTPGKFFRLAMSHRFEDAEDAWFKEKKYTAQARQINREVKEAPTPEQVAAVFA